MMKTPTNSTTSNTKLAKRSSVLVLGIVTLAALVLLCSCSSTAEKSTVTVTLASHGGAGYLWEYAADPTDILKETSHDTKTATNLAGGDVADTFIFAAQKGADEVTLTFSLKRPWENAENPDTVQYVFKVGDAKNVTLSSKGGTAADIPDPVIS